MADPRPSRRSLAAAGILAVVLLLTGFGLLVERSGLLDPSGESSPAPPETLEEQLARVAADVERVRDLEFEQPPEPTYLVPEELARRASSFLEEYTEADADTDRRVLAALGAIPRDADLRDVMADVLAEQVAGFYDPETGELVVGSTRRGERLGPTSEVILAHELQHALADQVLGLPDPDEHDTAADASFAATALVEGDATLTMIQYADEYLSAVDHFRMLGEDLGTVAGMDEFESLPHVLQRSLLFPYEDGLRFVMALHASDGWEAVNAAYARPPASTLQILEPDRYVDGTGTGRDPTDPASPGGDWQRRERVTVGAADLLFLFEAPGDDRTQALDDAGAVARSWRGGEVVLWTRGEDSAVGVSLLGGADLCGAVTTWYTRAFPGATGGNVPGSASFDGDVQDAVVRCSAGDPQEVVLGIAPDLETAAAIAR